MKDIIRVTCQLYFHIYSEIEEVKVLIDKLKFLETIYRQTYKLPENDDKSLWFKFSPDDTLCTTISDIENDLSKPHSSNYNLMIQKMNYAVLNDSLEIYYS